MIQQIDVKAISQEVPGYKILFEQAVFGIACVAFDGRFLEANPKFCNLVGYETGELLQSTFQNIFYLYDAWLLAVNTRPTPSTEFDDDKGKTNATAYINRVLHQGNGVFKVYCRHQDDELWPVEMAVMHQDVEQGLFFIYLQAINSQQVSTDLLELRHRLSSLVHKGSLKALMQAALDCAEALTGSQIGFFHFVNPDQRAVSLQAWSTNTLKTFCSAAGDGFHYPISKAGVWVDCIHQRCPVIHNDYASLTHKKGLPEGHPQLVRELTVPITRNGSIVAVFGVGNKRVAYTETDIHMVQEVSDLAFDYIEHMQIEERVKFMACYDTLTGLPNRILLFDLLTQAMAQADNSNSTFALAYMDLDGFKPVNDHYGHDIGDQLLAACAQRLAEPLRKGDTLSRLGGDEFALILVGLMHPYDGEVMLRRVLETLERPFQVANQEIWLSASFGFTIYPLDQTGAETLLRHADQAMYQAKRQGKNTICLYDAASDKRQQFYQQALKELCQATLAKDELLFYYQPKVNLISGEVIGVEALIRWRHPRRGLLRPNEFLPALNASTETVRFDKWVINQALIQIAAWETIGESFPVSVNINHKNLCQKWFFDFIRFQAAQWPKTVISRLEIEVQESATVTDFEALAQVMAGCVELGIRFILDGFGTGCYSLNRFWHLPIHAITLDHKFVRGMLDNAENLKIVEEVTCLAQDFQLPVIAKGVETLELAALLIDLGCPLAQGYSIAQPMPSELVAEWCSKWPHDPRHLELCQLDPTGTTTDALIKIIVSGVQRWSDCVTHFVDTVGVSERPLLCDEQCNVTHWYNGLGRLRYGHRPGFPFLDARHRGLHLLASELVNLVELGHPYHDSLAKLYALRDEFITLLQGLVE